MIKRHKRIVVAAGLLLLAGCVTVPPEERPESPGDLQRTVNAPPDRTGADVGIDGDSTLDDYLRRAFAGNPGLQTARDRWKAALERIPQARSLDDPSLSFAYFIEQMDTR